jgi:prepilin-type N-terminal cleavage/methylation domain-containing protein/prepilin-type processing-associated H-X9-DG protein
MRTGFRGENYGYTRDRRDSVGRGGVEPELTGRTVWAEGRDGPRGRAFTLVELLVVMAVLSILAGILLPALARARAQTQRQGCVSNMRQLALVLVLYSQDYDERLPTFYAEPRSAVRSRQVDYWHDRFCSGLELAVDEQCWVHLVVPYTHNERVFFCPTDGKPEERPVTSYEYKPALAQDPSLSAIEHPASVAALYEQWSYHLDRQSEYDASGGSNIAFLDGHVAWRLHAESTSARYHGWVDLHWLHPHNTTETPCNGRDFLR